jgi:hypothetical protein
MDHHRAKRKLLGMPLSSWVSPIAVELLFLIHREIHFLACPGSAGFPIIADLCFLATAAEKATFRSPTLI